jgi:hypothetical protein
MDSGDKATNKAMSIAYKNAIFMTFSVPTEGDNDPDAQAHEVSPTSMSETNVEKHLSSMSGAISVEALQAAWITASEAATDAKDKGAYRRFVGCANARKAALAGEEEKAA